MRANAQAILNSANATLAAVQTQEQNNANALAAKLAATAKIERANAKATLIAAGSTQSAALTQDAIQQTQAQYSRQQDAEMETQNASAIAQQQQIDEKLAPKGEISHHSKDDQALRWLDEVGHKLLGRYKKDNHDNSDY